MYPVLEKRRSLVLVLSLFISFFFCASYWLWSGGEHVRLVPSFQDGGGGGGEVKEAPKEVVVTKPLPPAPPVETETVKSGSEELRPDEIVLAEYDETPIREMCANSSWADSRNVVVNCEARVGGVGMLPPSPPITPNNSS